jgi:hypothetical protein
MLLTNLQSTTCWAGLSSEPIEAWAYVGWQSRVRHVSISRAFVACTLTGCICDDPLGHGPDHKRLPLLALRLKVLWIIMDREAML